MTDQASVRVQCESREYTQQQQQQQQNIIYQYYKLRTMHSNTINTKNENVNEVNTGDPNPITVQNNTKNLYPVSRLCFVCRCRETDEAGYRKARQNWLETGYVLPHRSVDGVLIPSSLEIFPEVFRAVSKYCLRRLHPFWGVPAVIICSLRCSWLQWSTCNTWGVSYGVLFWHVLVVFKSF